MTANVPRVGQYVKANVKDKSYEGYLRYLGPIDGVVGSYAGLELLKPEGKNDGSVKGKVYFTCADKHGLFVNPSLVTAMPAPKSTTKRTSTIATSKTSNAPTTRTGSTSTATKRQSTVAPSRISTARPSVANTPSTRRTPTSSRPSSQTITRDTVTVKPQRRSAHIQSTPREQSPSKRQPVEIQHEESSGESENEEIGAYNDDADDQEDNRKEKENGHGIGGTAEAEQLIESPPKTASSARVTTAARTLPKEQNAPSTQVTRENEQLKVKLRAMEKKRMEDRDAIKQVDTLKSENDRLTKLLQNLGVKLKKVTEDKSTALARVQELEQEKNDTPERPPQLESELELATIDKELAEERVDALDRELAETKSKLEELELESEILREENKELTSSMTDEEKAGAGWMHLERERDRLREALLLLRDHSKEQEIDLKEEIEHLRENLIESEETAEKYLQTAEQLQKMEDTNNHLKEQLEAAENQEELISNMMQERDRHLGQIEDLRMSLSELDELAQTNEDLEKLYLDNERGLLSRLDEQEAVLLERDKESAEKDQMIEDLEYTLNKFRSVMQGLQSDIDESRRTREISEIQAQEMKSRSKAMMDLNMKLQNNASKSQRKQIEYEVVKAEARLNKFHLDILSMFLPETFDSERTPILALLSFSSLRTKAALVANMLSEKHRDRAQFIPSEESLIGSQVILSMQRVSLIADRFIKYLSTCSPDEFTAFSHAGQEIEPVVRVVSNWLEAVKNDEMGIDSPDQLRRMESILMDMMEKLLTSSAEAKVTQLISEVYMVTTYSEVIASLLDWLARVVKTKLGDPTDDDPASIDFDRKTDHLSRLARTAKLSSSKAITELEKKKNKNTCIGETAWPLFTEVEQTASSISERVQKLCQIIVTHLDENEGDANLSYSDLLESLDDDNDDILRAIFVDLKSLQEMSENLVNKVNESSAPLRFEPKPAPWSLRAKELKAQRLMSVEVQDELTHAAQTNRDLLNRLSERERAIEEVTMRAELAEKRVKDNKSKEGQDKALKDELGNLKSEKDELAIKVSELESELMTAQDEKRQIRKDLVSLQAQTSDDVTKRASTPTTAPPVNAYSQDITFGRVSALMAEIRGLQATIRHLTWENRELAIPISETRFKAVSQAWLDPRNLKSWGTKTNSSNGHLRSQQHDPLDDLLDMSVNMTLKPVRLKDTWPKDDRWRQARETTRWQVLRQKEDAAAWDHLRDTNLEDYVLRVR